jgi:hypothetical protein
VRGTQSDYGSTEFASTPTLTVAKFSLMEEKAKEEDEEALEHRLRRSRCNRLAAEQQNIRNRMILLCIDCFKLATTSPHIQLSAEPTLNWDCKQHKE